MNPRTSGAQGSCSILHGRKLQGKLCACFLSHPTGMARALDGRVWWEIGHQVLPAVGVFEQAESGLGPWEVREGFVCSQQTRGGDSSVAVASVCLGGVSSSPSGSERHKVCSAALGGLLSASQRSAAA